MGFNRTSITENGKRRNNHMMNITIFAVLSLFMTAAWGDGAMPLESRAASQTAPLALGIDQGPTVASELQRRYEYTPVNCGSDSKPAFLCSGVDMRGTLFSTDFDSWDPSPTAIKVKGVSFSYLRVDYDVHRLANGYTKGFIFYPVLSAPKAKLKIEILCFYPVDSASDLRLENGCGARPGIEEVTRPCDLQNIMTGEQWAEHFLASSNRYALTCSFNVRDSQNNLAGPRFYQGLRAGQLVSPEAFNKPNDLKHALWGQGQAKNLPIEAFFYVTSAGIAGAQHDQRRFYELTDNVIPIIHLALPATIRDHARFTYSLADQYITPPQALVDSLNARYKNVTERCDGVAPAYYCSGILLRGLTYSAAYKFWTHSPAAANLGSLTFTYIRKDMAIRSLVNNSKAGMVFSDQNTALAQTKAQTVRCIYPFATATQNSGRREHGCGMRNSPPQSDADPASCDQLTPPSLTINSWLAEFSSASNNRANQCSLSAINADQFYAALQVHDQADAGLLNYPNEVLVATWDESAPEKLPIDAFFYSAMAGSLDEARALREDYFQVTGSRLPLVKLDLSAAGGDVFSVEEL